MKPSAPRGGWKAEILDWVSLLSGTLVMAAAYPMFFVPCSIAPGGFSGLSTILHILFGVPVGLVNFLLCLPLFALSFKKLGRRFFVRSLIATGLSSLFIDILPLPAVTENLLLAAIFGGVLLGIGLGLVMRADATTGGSDMAAALLHERFPLFSVGGYTFGIDGMVILVSAFCFSLEAGLVAVIAVFVQSVLMDRIVRGFDNALAYMILSEKNEQITQRLMKELERGVTLFSASGAYTRRETKAVLCVLRKTQVGALRTIVREEDPSAFVIAADVSEVMGEGFSRLG